MNLVIDIGNTSIKTGCFRNGELIKSEMHDAFTSQTAAELISQYKVQNGILSTVKENDESVGFYLQQNLSFFINLTHHTPLPFKILYQTPALLGKDRIAAIAGAFQSFPQKNVLVIDMGTAITYDFITRKGEYTGGNISPGLVTRFKALHTFTSQLPLMEKDELVTDLGTDTRSAIISGVQTGIIFEINGYIDHFTSQHADLMIILTGGDAHFFVNKLKKTIFVIPNLILNGLNYILDYNARKV
ncbi:MAG: type III pantothenate kinase [Bacteroidales bacterium]|nr:type III pantothenate kinase [Bacteroidales bacterium]MBN2763876.1 type III pantothenate kinase [Bacteroidales bacterium]